MKKVLIITIIALLVILTGITMVKGLNIGNINILGIKTIKEKNDELDSTIEQATKLASTDYQKNINNLNDEIKKLETQKKSYDDMVNVSTENQVNVANHFNAGYPIEYLWVKIGTHAKNEGVEMKMEVTKSSSGTQDTYNLNFTATGLYIHISEFIRDIEDDSALGFKIEDFKMVPSSDTTTLQGTFTCKDIKITGISTNSVTTNTSETNTTVDTNSTTNTTDATSANNNIETKNTTK